MNGTGLFDKNTVKQLEEYEKHELERIYIQKLIARMRRAKINGRVYKEFKKLYINREMVNEQIRRTGILRELQRDGYRREEAGKIYEQYYKRNAKTRFEEDADMLARMLLATEKIDLEVILKLWSKNKAGGYDTEDLCDRIRKILGFG